MKFKGNESGGSFWEICFPMSLSWSDSGFLSQSNEYSRLSIYSWSWPKCIFRFSWFALLLILFSGCSCRLQMHIESTDSKQQDEVSSTET